jgi:protoporphyrinogen oxidase
VTSTAVLGAGALGLTLALRLAQRGHSVSVLEAQPIAGGLASGFHPVAGSPVWLEKFYHHLFRSDTRAIAMIEELGLGDRLEWRQPVTATLVDGQIHQLDSARSLVGFSPLRLGDRARMGAVLAALKLMPSPRLLEGQTAARWLRRWMGEAAYATVWEPLLRGKFGDAVPEIAMPWFWARVHDRSQSLGYLRGGFQQLYEALADAVRSAGGETRFETLVTSVTSVDASSAGRFMVETRSGAERFDQVVSTLAPRLTARLVPELPQSWRERHEWGRAYGAHCVVIALDRPLTSVYWLNMNDPGYPFMALVEHTNYIPAADYGGRHLLYLGNYRPMDDPLSTASRDEVLDKYLPHLERLNPLFRRDWLLDAWVFTAPFAQPIVTVDYRDHIPPFRTPIRDLWTATMFQVYPHDRGQNYSIALAERLAKRITG